MSELGFDSLSIISSISDFDGDEIIASPDTSSHKMGPRVEDPSTFAGQQLGAVLVVKHTAKPPSTDGSPRAGLAVGDYVKISAFSGPNELTVRNLKTGEDVRCLWECFFPLPVTGNCACDGVACRCIIEDPERYYAYHHTFEADSKSTDPIKPTDPQHNAYSYVKDPSTVEGQKIHAVLIVKSKHWEMGPKEGLCHCEVGDFVEVLSHSWVDKHHIKIKNLRTGEVGGIMWKSMFPIPLQGYCGCGIGSVTCRCVFENFMVSRGNAINHCR